MAEAVAAIGLASSIITLLGLGIKSAKLTKQIHDAQGELPKDLQKCQSTVDEFSQWLRDVQPKQWDQSGPLTRADQAMKTAIDHCVEDSAILLKILQDLLPSASSTNAQSAKISNFKTALRTIRQDGRVKKAQKALEKDKNELRLRIAERTMALVEDSRDTGLAQLHLSQSIERLQKDAQQLTLQSKDEILSVQKSHQNESRQLYADLTQLQAAGHDENRKIESNLKQLQLASKEEIIACIAQHNLQFNQIHDLLGLMELDLDNIKNKGDDTILLVKQLANAIDEKANGSAMICIRLPKTLFDPSLSMWNEFRAYTEKVKEMALPGGWIEEPFNVPDRQLGSFLPSDARESYLAVSPYNTAVGRLSWSRNLVGPSWSMLDFQAAYDRHQSLLAKILGYETVAIRPVPLLVGPNEDGENACRTYRLRKPISSAKADTERDETDGSEVSRTNVESSILLSQSLENPLNPQVEDESILRDEDYEIQIGIRRRESLPADVTVEESDLDTWLNSMEDALHRQRAQELEPYININKRLLETADVSEGDESVEADIKRMQERFEKSASYEMPELVQMMTTKAEGETDNSGQCFRWGFHLVVARNEVHFQSVVFLFTMGFVFIFDPVSSRPAKLVTYPSYQLLCASSNRSFWPSFVLWSVRILASLAAGKCWINYHKLAIIVARRFAARNPPWEDVMRSKRTPGASTNLDRKVKITMALVNLASVSWTAPSWLGNPWETLLCYAWIIWLCSMVVSSLLLAKDWFKLHSNVQLHVYGLGSLLAIVVFISSILLSIQNKA